MTGVEDGRADAADLFVDGAPEVAIGGLSVARSILQQDETASTDAKKDQDITWRIYGYAPGVEVSSEGGPPLVVYGDLGIEHDGWFLGVTAVAMVGFRDAKKWLGDDELNGDRAVKTLGPWLTHVLYDTAAATARTLISSTTASPFVIPLKTPPASIEALSD